MAPSNAWNMDGYVGRMMRRPFLDEHVDCCAKVDLLVVCRLCWVKGLRLVGWFLAVDEPQINLNKPRFT